MLLYFYLIYQKCYRQVFPVLKIELRTLQSKFPLYILFLNYYRIITSYTYTIYMPKIQILQEKKGWRHKRCAIFAPDLKLFL